MESAWESIARIREAGARPHADRLAATLAALEVRAAMRAAESKTHEKFPKNSLAKNS